MHKRLLIYILFALAEITACNEAQSADIAVLDDIKSVSGGYLSGIHARYDDLSSQKDASHPDIAVIDGNVYYFNADEATPELTQAVRNLARTGSVAIKEGSSENYVFSAGGKFYTYDEEKLPQSAFSLTQEGANAGNYSFRNKSGDADVYSLVNLREAQMSTNNKTVWQSSDNDGVSGYSFSDNSTAALASTPSYIFADGVLSSVEGAVRFNLPHNGETPAQYYIYSYTNPYAAAGAQIETSLAGDIEEKYFYGLSNTNGGAVFNNAAGAYSIIADFINNSAVTQGGALFNDKEGVIGDITGNFIGNSAKNSGAIGNKGTMGAITGDFIANKTTAYGGAIMNNGGSIESITGNFIGNYAGTHSGAVYNDGTIGAITGDFIGNYAKTHAGAIYNQQGTIGTITGDFIGNASKQYGGAIYNNEGVIGTITGDFVGNSSNFYGGVIFNTGRTIDSIKGDFIGNKGTYGGVIYNRYASHFVGAEQVYYYGEISSITGNFIGNSATTASGGALYNMKDSIMDDITGNFIDNSAKKFGGAIFNQGKIALNADTQDITFYNNVDKTGYNDIANSKTINLNASEGKSITFNGTVMNYNSAGSLHINSGNGASNEDNDPAKTGGSYIFNNGVIDNNIYLHNGANVTLGSAVQQDGTVTRGYIDNTAVDGVLETDGASAITISMQNGGIDTINVGALTIGADSPIMLAIDLNLATGESDIINAGSIVAAANSIVINAINIIDLPNETTFDVAWIKNADLYSVYTLADSINFTVADGLSFDDSSVITYDAATGYLHIAAGETPIPEPEPEPEPFVLKPTIASVKEASEGYLALLGGVEPVFTMISAIHTMLKTILI